MSQDRWIYYDFSSEKELKNWINIIKNEDLFSFDMPFSCEEDGEYILLAPESNSAPDKWDPCLESLTVDGKSFRIPDDLDPYFIGKTGSRNGLFLTLKKGEHLLQGKGSTSVDNPEDFITLSLIKNPLCKVEGKPGRVFSYTVEKEYT
ncbi:MAG: hypothetical protein J6S58_11070, partial [Lentisphaeria bacterium]|nr:hypothetical protein [Lentisphaeria bacterium]